MPKGTGTIYFKRRDKFKLEPGDGFMVLPKEAFPGNPVDAIRTNFTVSYAGSAKVDNEPVHVLKLVPKTQDAGGAVQLYVEKRRGLILKADSANAGGADMKSRWTYVRADGKYWMPQQIRVNMSGVMSPQAFDPRDMKTKPPKSGKGTATVKFSNYRINKGIPDSVFVEKKGSKPRLRGHVNSR
jgi:outer membrane lipoprotein-sorting protein